MKKFFLLFLLSVVSSPFLYAQSWTATDSPTDESLNAIHFVDKHFGWAVGENGTILHTSDGGVTWETQNGRTTEDLHDLFFFDELRGWIAGDESTFLYTDDGGETWADRRPLSAPGQHIYAVHFNDWKHGWTAGGPGNFIYNTDDAGLTWSRTFSVSGEMNIHTIQFTDRGVGFAADSSQIYTIQNSSNDWNELQMPEDADLFSLQDFFAINDSTLYAVFNKNGSNTIKKTEDKGEKWNDVFQIEGKNLTSIFFKDPDYGWATGSNGTLLETKNGGVDWNIEEVADAKILKSIHYSHGFAWAAGSGGSILRFPLMAKLTPPPFKVEYPEVQIEDEDEAIELLNRVLEYLNGPEMYSDPMDRRPFYHRVRGAISSVEHYYVDKEMPESISERIFEIITSFWAEEHNKGAELFSEAEASDDPVQSKVNAGHHFKNAILLQPDSTQSYRTLSFVFEDLAQFENAIHTYSRVLEISSEPHADDFEYLINLYLVTDNFDKALEKSSKAVDLFPETNFFREVIADYHIEKANHQKAIDALDKLIELSPDTPQYRISRAGQAYSILLETLEESLSIYEELWRLREDLFRDLPPSEEQRVQQEIDRKLSLISNLEQRETDKMENIQSVLEAVFEIESDHERAHSLLGTIAKSRASFYIEKITLTHEPDEVERFENKIESDLLNAKEHLEMAVEINPGSSENLQTLYEVYTLLGMETRASEIRSRFYD